MSSGDKNVELLQGALDLIILRALSTMAVPARRALDIEPTIALRTE